MLGRLRAARSGSDQLESNQPAPVSEATAKNHPQGAAVCDIEFEFFRSGSGDSRSLDVRSFLDLSRAVFSEHDRASANACSRGAFLVHSAMKDRSGMSFILLFAWWPARDKSVAGNQ